MSSSTHSRRTNYKKRLGDFYIYNEPLARGSHAYIHLGKLVDPQNTKWPEIGDKYIVIKMMHPVGGGKFPAETEANIIKYLPKHNGLLRLYGTFKSGEYIALVMEYMDGGDLYDKGIEDDEFDENRLRIAMRDATGALLELHNTNIIHLDIKPENLMLIKRGYPSTKVIDYGFAHRITSKDKEPKFLRGTICYLAPEQIQKYLSTHDALTHPNQESQDHAQYKSFGAKSADVWSLGLSAFDIIRKKKTFYHHKLKTSTLQDLLKCIYSKNWEEKIDGLRMSPEGKDWLKGMLKLDKSRRFTMEAAHNHPWIQGKQLPDVRTQSPTRTVPNPIPPKDLSPNQTGNPQKGIEKVVKRLISGVDAPLPTNVPVHTGTYTTSVLPSSNGKTRSRKSNSGQHQSRIKTLRNHSARNQVNATGTTRTQESRHKTVDKVVRR